MTSFTPAPPDSGLRNSDAVAGSTGPRAAGGTHTVSAPARLALASRRIGMRALSVLVLLGLWQSAAVAAGNPSFVPAPRAVWDQLVLLSTTHDGIRGYSGHLLVEHLGISLRRILIGSALGVAAGLVLGVVLGVVPWIRVVAEPVVTFIRALPPLAYFSLLIIWFGIDETPKLWLLAIAAMPPVAVATAAAVHGAPTGLVEAARALGASRWRTLTDVVLPSALPEIFTGIRLAVGIAYSSVVAAETVNGVPGIGGMVRDAQRYLQTDVVVLGLFAIGASGLLIDALLRAAENRLIPWRGRT
ncbi:ABC transporter permease [Streptosporangium fragile]|uniref:ABC transporter permease n=2 Tax=Streptosporangium fragile TaxID=46186 RepID=A0ABP6IL39_9ACTN